MHCNDESSLQYRESQMVTAVGLDALLFREQLFARLHSWPCRVCCL